MLQMVWCQSLYPSIWARHVPLESSPRWIRWEDWFSRKLHHQWLPTSYRQIDRQRSAINFFFLSLHIPSHDIVILLICHLARAANQTVKSIAATHRLSIWWVGDRTGMQPRIHLFLFFLFLFYFILFYFFFLFFFFFFFLPCNDKSQVRWITNQPTQKWPGKGTEDETGWTAGEDSRRNVKMGRGRKPRNEIKIIEKKVWWLKWIWGMTDVY